MEGNIVHIKDRRQDQVFECGECGCQVFFLLANRLVECYRCGLKVNNIFTTDQEPENTEI